MNFGTTKVVEYLEPLMSKELLCKFPDNSAFDFDYSQSSIWSPLVPRSYKSIDFDSDMDFATPRKLDFEAANENCSLKKVTSNMKKRIRTTNFSVNLSALKSKKKSKKNKKKSVVSDLSASPFKGACNPVTKKVPPLLHSGIFWYKQFGTLNLRFSHLTSSFEDHVRMNFKLTTFNS